MVRLEPVRTGFAFATFSGVISFLWIVLVVLGFATSFANSILQHNFIVATVQIAPFEFSKAFSLLCIRIGLGFIAGIVFALIWNSYRRY